MRLGDKREWYDSGILGGIKKNDKLYSGFIAKKLDEIQTNNRAEYLNLVYKSNPISQIGILFIVVLFITSFYGTTILEPYTTCMLMLFVAYTFVLKRADFV